MIRGFIGFDGLLMSDDLSMQALSGTLEERTRASLAAGCDLALHCNGKMEEMAAVAVASPPLEGQALRRFEAALAARKEPEAFAREEAEEARAEALAALGVNHSNCAPACQGDFRAHPGTALRGDRHRGSRLRQSGVVTRASVCNDPG